VYDPSRVPPGPIHSDATRASTTRAIITTMATLATMMPTAMPPNTISMISEDRSKAKASANAAALSLPCQLTRKFPTAGAPAVAALI